MFDTTINNPVAIRGLSEIKDVTGLTAGTLYAIGDNGALDTDEYNSHFIATTATEARMIRQSEI